MLGVGRRPLAACNSALLHSICLFHAFIVSLRTEVVRESLSYSEMHVPGKMRGL